MDSPATPKTPRSHRKPLQPKNLNSIPPPDTLPMPMPKPKPKPKPISAGADAEKENRREPEASLGEELEAARRRRERLRAARERTEQALTARDATMAAAMLAVERRAEEQLRLESELRRLVALTQLRSSCMRSCSVQSLRAREEERRSREADQPQEPSSLVVDKEVATPSKAREEEIAT